MMMKKITTIWRQQQHGLFTFSCLLLSVTLIFACSDIDESERLTVVNYVEVDTTAVEPTPQDTIDFFAPTTRRILVEDFTGQDCVNCPNATDLIAQLQEMYGHNTVVAVGIHSGPLGVKPSKHPEGLATDLGDTYYNYWNIEMQPYGVIDRSDGPLSTDWWAAKVSYDLYADDAKTTLRTVPLNIWVQVTTTQRQAEIDIVLAGTSGTITGKLQVWLVEKGIKAFQKMPDGSTKTDYVHNHVLRCAVNGDWGEDCTVAEGKLQTFSYTCPIDAGWKFTNIDVVAFVYNEDGVVQVTTTDE